MPVEQNQTISFGPFELDTQSAELRKSGYRLKLQGQPIQVLEMLLAKAGELVTREEIRRRLWTEDTFVDFDHSLNTAVKKLRQALGDEADSPRYVETLPKRGYRFIGEVVTDTPCGVSSDDGSTVSDPLVSSLHQESRASKKSRLFIYCAVLFVLAGSIYWMTQPSSFPRITGSHSIVRNTFAYPNCWLPRIFTDGKSLYYQEERPSGVVTLQHPVNGGEASVISAVPGRLQDVSRDGSALLFIVPDPNHGDEIWTQPLPAGQARLIIRGVSLWAIWASDGQGIFFTRNRDTELYRASADGTNVQRIVTLPDISGPHLSPDGLRIRFSTAPNFAMWEVNADGSNPHPILAGHKYADGGTWSIDQGFYFFSGWDGDRYSLWASPEEHSWLRRPWWKKTTAIPQQLTVGPSSVGSPLLSNDGKQIYAVGRESQGELAVYDRKSAKFISYLGGTSICFVDFSRDGKWITYVSYPDGTLWRSRIDGSEKRQLTSPPMGVANPRWSPDGKLIAFTDMANGDRRKMDETSPRRLYVVSEAGGSPLLVGSDSNPEDPTWSPDGNSLAYGTSNRAENVRAELRILDLRSMKSAVMAGSQGMWSPRWSPDGKYLVALNGDSFQMKAMLFTVATGTWQELTASASLGWPAWSHDSKFVSVEDGPSLMRIEISSHKKEQFASLSGLRSTAYYFDRWGSGWFGLDPDDRPITTRDTGVEGIYAFDLEQK
jgi:DNA-binding winged helix-turn-helix (wHTH) protein/Tol biopolymer transport system component